MLIYSKVRIFLCFVCMIIYEKPRKLNFNALSVGRKIVNVMGSLQIFDNFLCSDAIVRIDVIDCISSDAEHLVTSEFCFPSKTFLS